MKQLMTGLLVSALLLVGGVPWAMADQILLRQSDGTMTPWGGVGEKGSVTCDNCSGGGGGAVQTLTIASGVTTNTTTAAVAGVSGDKTYWARVAGTGAVTATVEFLGCHSTTVSAAECVSLGTIALSGTTSKYNVPTPAVGTANYPYMAVTTTNVTGTGATVSAGVYY
jgi:hypothetical protein